MANRACPETPAYAGLKEVGAAKEPVQVEPPANVESRVGVVVGAENAESKEEDKKEGVKEEKKEKRTSKGVMGGLWKYMYGSSK